MHSVSTVQIPKNITNFSLLQPSVRIKPLNLQSASSFHVPSISINKCFYNGPKVVISPLKSSIQRLSSFNKRTLHNRPECILEYLSAMPRGACVVIIYLAILLSVLQSMDELLV